MSDEKKPSRHGCGALLESPSPPRLSPDDRAASGTRDPASTTSASSAYAVTRDSALQRPQKRYRIGVSTMPATRLRCAATIDFLFNQTADLRTLTVLAVTDEFTREVPAIEVDRSIDADHAVGALDGIVAVTGRRPELLRMDDGPEFTAHALRDWCHFLHAGSTYIEPQCPLEKPFMEPFSGKLRGDRSDCEIFETLFEAKGVGRGLPHRLQHLSTTLLAQRRVAIPVRRAVADRPGTDSQTWWTRDRGQVNTIGIVGGSHYWVVTSRHLPSVASGSDGLHSSRGKDRGSS